MARLGFRNTQTLFYAQYSDKIPVLDSDGYETGEYTVGYDNPVLLDANVVDKTSRIAREYFGNDIVTLYNLDGGGSSAFVYKGNKLNGDGDIDSNGKRYELGDGYELNKDTVFKYIWKSINGEEATTPDKGEAVPKTFDNITSYIIMFIISTISLIAVIIINKRKLVNN